MDGRKMTVTKTHAGSHPWFVIREAEDDVMVARFETEADALLFTQAGALSDTDTELLRTWSGISSAWIEWAIEHDAEGQPEGVTETRRRVLEIRKQRAT
jgi:hypothetical protein